MLHWSCRDQCRDRANGSAYAGVRYRLGCRWDDHRTKVNGNKILLSPLNDIWFAVSIVMIPRHLEYNR